MTHLALSTQVLLTRDTNYQWLTLHCQPKSSSHVTITTNDSPCAVNSVRRSGSSAFSLFSMSIILKVHRPVYRHSWYHWETGWKWTCWFHWDTRCIRTWSQCVPHLCGKWSVYCNITPQHLYWGTDKIFVYYELVRALCEEAMVCILGSVPQFVKDMGKNCLHYWSRLL